RFAAARRDSASSGHTHLPTHKDGSGEKVGARRHDMNANARQAARDVHRSSSKPVDRPPLHVRLFSPVLKAMVRAGVPLGFNRLMTVRRRKSGEPRTVAVAVIPIKGRPWVWAPWRDVHWVQNLRAARHATIRASNREEEVIAIELN